ncbi:MAG: hypothetical protein K9K65_14850 [Desulfarculaceae bacterium]|nr:hypothetical protein [Desulfarculaceae bacterium]MCF8046909.1 hypothetical protein [Desulfarculaceae bacterium]MCF8063900.1 hypothetical protein [Desulfarculaceae bacterium]MCF8099115.1 hypothetical protein [Desulfarculaceae bacterium]MCF8121203.1 hypothetical protein [Desulfarculaceae bacterium]
MAACRKSKESFPEQPTPAQRPSAVASQEDKGSDDVVDRYLVGDFHERLDLWLTHRDLRPTLSRLDKAMHDE